MRSFTHVTAGSLAEACALLSEAGGKGRANAGGTDLLGVLKDGIHAQGPELIVDLKAVSGLAEVSREGDEVRIGALATLASLDRSTLLRETLPLLVQAAHAVGTPQVRTMGTVGGNLCQEVRCWYYRYPRHVGGPVGCLRKGDGPCLAVKGDNRYHGVFGGRGCFAVCPSDLAVALTALGAVVDIAGPDGSRREVAVEDLYEPTTLTLAPGELLAEVRVPVPARPTRQTFLKFTVREPVDFAVVSVAASLDRDGPGCRDARIVLGGVSPRPHRALQAEEVLRGGDVDDQTAARAGEAAVAGAKPMRHNAYKIGISRTLVERAVRACLDA